MYHHICIFGADGRTGTHVVDACLAHNHTITAAVYDNTYTNLDPKTIRVVSGDIQNPQTAMCAITSDTTAVISALGHIKGSDALMQTNGITNIIAAMRHHGVRRLVSLTGTGVRQDGDSIPWYDHLGNFIIGKIDPKRIADGATHVDAIQGSDLDWTILRVLKLTDNNHADGYTLSPNGPVSPTSPRKRVAEILVDLAISDAYVHHMPIDTKSNH